MRYSVRPSGPWAPRSRRLRANQLRTVLDHSSGISDRRLNRARTSSLRFVSCVVEASIVAGHASLRAVIAAWSSATDTAGAAGFPPTSSAATTPRWR